MFVVLRGLKLLRCFSVNCLPLCNNSESSIFSTCGDPLKKVDGLILLKLCLSSLVRAPNRAWYVLHSWLVQFCLPVLVCIPVIAFQFA